MQDIVAGMGPADAETQAQAVRILQGSSPHTSLGLDDAALAQLCDEIRASGQRVHTMADVEVWLPKTYAFIHSESARLGTTDADLQLQALVASLHPVPPAQLPDKHVVFIADEDLITTINSAKASSDGGMAALPGPAGFAAARCHATC